MESLTNLRIVYIGENVDEWRIFFTFDETEETMAFYHGMTIKAILATLLSFIKTIMNYYL